MAQNQLVNTDTWGTFELSDDFIQKYASKEVPWGFGDMSWVTYKRTYSRKKDNGEQEEWFETCRRVIEGMFTVQMCHCKDRSLPWDDQKARRFARDAYDRLFHFKWTPPGRGLWSMGTDFVYNRSSASLFNCAFTSTSNIDEDYGEPFSWMLQMSMLGVGVGYDTRGKGEITIQEPEVDDEPHVIGDSREGWAEAVERLMNAFAGNTTLPSFWDYSEIRPKGAEIKSFGGTASGPEPLKEAIERITQIHRDRIGEKVDAEVISDTFNLLGKCVVAGGTRRSALIALGDKDDDQFLDLKMDQEKVNDYRWASNNSVFAEVGMDYSEVAERTLNNGEPGYVWMENARKYGRFKDGESRNDKDVQGVNPCGEIMLESEELCNLSEIYPAHHDSYEDLRQTIKIAYQYSKTVSLIPTHSEKTNEVMLRNRRIGCSMTGIVQAVNKHGYREFFDWCDKGYEFIQELDEKYSNWLCVPTSIKTTTTKPSGTVSLLAGATPGVHWQHSPYFIRRMRASKGSRIVDLCQQAGYPMEESVYDDTQMIIEFPVKTDGMKRSKFEVDVREKVDLASKVQRYWSDNGVSITAEYDPDTTTPEKVERILESYEDRLKAVSFLPCKDHGYAQPPYEKISKAEYERRVSEVDQITRTDIEHDREDKFCSGKQCEV